MREFVHEDLTGANFRDVYLTDARLRDVDLRGMRVRAALIDRMDLDGEASTLLVNGVDVMPYVEAELDRRHPGRALMRPTDADGFRDAWDLLERLWAQTVDRARRLDEARLHESVDGEWSFISTLRHLAFATDCWVGRALLGDPAPWHPLSLPFDEMPPTRGVPWDRDARPSLDEALALRASRADTVRAVLADLTDERLDQSTEPVDAPGWPPPESFPVRECLAVVLNEEWQHRLYAERDLDVLTGSGDRAPRDDTGPMSP